MSLNANPNDTTMPDNPPRDYLPWLYWALFFLTIPIAFWMANKPLPQVTAPVPVPVGDIPAYHLLEPHNLTTKPITVTLIATDTVREVSDLMTHYTIEPLAADRPISSEQIRPLPDVQLITNSVAIGIPATSAMVLGGSLQPGDIVDVITVPAVSDTELLQTPVAFEGLLVLDIKPNPATAGEHTYPFVIVLALPLDRRMEFAARTTNATLQITRQP